jgi:hypothetical protein
MSLNQHSLLRSYLLGNLSQDESLALTEKCFEDEVLFDELLEVENELLDEYVSERLTFDERKKFEGYLSKQPDGKAKLATAYILRKSALEKFSTPKVLLKTEPSLLHTMWQTISDLFLGKKFFFQYGLATLALVLVFGSLYLLYIKNWRQSNDNRLQAGHTQPGQPEPSPEPVQPNTNNGDSKNKNETVEPSPKPKPSSSPQKSPQQSTTSFATLILTPALRGGATTDTLKISKDTKFARLQMKVDSDEMVANYKAVLQTTDGNIILTQEKLKPGFSKGGRFVVLQLNTSQLNEESYKLTLIGRTTSGIEIPQEFRFNVVKKN